MFLLSAASTAISVYYGMHKVMYPLMGIAFTLFVVLVYVGCAKQLFPSTVVVFLQYFLLAFQLLSVIFLFISTAWDISIQLGVSAAFGFYVLLSDDNKSKHLMFSILALFNFFCTLGKVSFLGYGVALPEFSAGGGDPAALQTCMAFYNVSENSGLCTGYQNYLRFLGFCLIFCQALQTFISYELFRQGGSGSTKSGYVEVGQ